MKYLILICILFSFVGCASLLECKEDGKTVACPKHEHETISHSRI